jgi:hypothetical protein
MSFLTLVGAVAGWFLGRVERGVDGRIVERYSRWVLREETFVLVRTPRARMREALTALEEAGREPATFMIRPGRVGLDGETSALAEKASLDRLREHATSLAAVQKVGRP